MTVRRVIQQGTDWPAEDARLAMTAVFLPSLSSGLHSYGGVIAAAAGYMGEVTLLGPEALRVNPGRWVVGGTQSGVQGDYIVTNDAPLDLAIAPRDASLSRVDLLVVGVRDTAYTPNEGVNDAAVRIVPGTPALSGAVAPTLPANTISLGTVTVPPGTGSVSFTPTILAQQVAIGGIQPVRLLDTRISVAGTYDGQYRDHPTWGLQRWNATTAAWDDVVIDRIRTNNVGDVSPTSTGHPLQLGPDNAANLAADNNQIMARNNGATSGLGINNEQDSAGRYGDVGITGSVTVKGGTSADDGSQYQALVATRLRILSGNDAQQRNDDGTGTPSSLHPVQIGPDDSQHVIIDINEGMARSALTGVSTANPAGTGGGKVVPFTWQGLTVNSPSSDAEPISRGVLNGNSSLANMTAWQTFTPSSGFTTYSGGPGAKWIYLNGTILFSFGLTRGTTWDVNTQIMVWSTTWRPRYDQSFTAYRQGGPWSEVKIEASTGIMTLAFGAGASTTFSCSGTFVPSAVV